MLEVSIIEDIALLARMQDVWRALLARSETNEPTLSPAWMLTWWNIFGDRDGRALRAVVTRQGGRLIAIAPLLSRVHLYQPAIPFRRIEPLASGERPEEETCSDYVNVIVER